MNYVNFMVNPDKTTLDQIEEMCSYPAFNNSKIRIMSDGHSGKGCVVGTTATFNNMICPNTVGVDIHCSVSAWEIPNNIDYKKLDEIIHRYVPSGNKVHQIPLDTFPYYSFKCSYDVYKDVGYFDRSLGTLGGGNHFISVETDEASEKNYLIIHCGSRNLGVKVAEHYQKLAVEDFEDKSANAEKILRDNMKQYVESHSDRKAYQTFLDAIKQERDFRKKYNKDLCHISDDVLVDYINDVAVCGEWVVKNHSLIFDTIASRMGWERNLLVMSHHNYVEHNKDDMRTGIIRKGAIDANEGVLGIIPLNMRDGSLIVRGKGNEDWNCSAPHGAGRIMSRSVARKTLDVDEYRRSMDGIYTSSVCSETLDEAPFAYKNADAIAEAIAPTADIIAHLVPKYNFKAS